MDEIIFQSQELPIGDTVCWMTVNGEPIKSLWLRNDSCNLWYLFYREKCVITDYDFMLMKYVLIEMFYKLLELTTLV